jgi:peptide/nickel transport system ATP-binding protein
MFKLAKSGRDARNKMDEALTAVGLRPEDVLGRFPHQLSGGQRQRINVARALLLKPRLLIADEPVSMVDASLRANILESLKNMHRDHGVTIIYITHDLTTAYHVSDSIIVLYRGDVVEKGDVESVIRNPQHAYTRLLVDSIPWPNLDQKWGQHSIRSQASQDEFHAGAPTH